MNHRILSLDVLRGITIVGMIVVNNGVGERCFVPLEHAAWNGLTPTDLVFPFFLFMVGVSIALSLGKYSPAASLPLAKGPAIRKVLVRSVKLFVIGLLLTFSGPLLRSTPIPEILEGLRIWGVLQRIALCYGVVAMLAITLNHRYFIHTIIGLIVIYMGILVFGNGYAYDASINILAQVDRSIFGIDHLYHRSPVDPEGLLSTIPAIAHTMIGFLCCKYISIAGQTVESKIKVLKVAGLVMVALGFGLSLIGF